MDTSPSDLFRPRRTPAPTILETGLGAMAAVGTRKTLIMPSALHGSPGSAQRPSDSRLSPASSRKTQYIPPNHEQCQADPASQLLPGTATPVRTSAALPPIAGFLVSFTWDTSGHSYPIREGKSVVGSSASCDFVVAADPALSGEHFAVMVRGGRVKVRDLNSTNATRIDGIEIWGEAVDVTHGCSVEAGDTAFVLVLLPQILKSRVEP
jgi:hypothetical protein